MVAKKGQIPPYEAFGNELSPAVSFLQAACLLDIAAGFAVEARDTETITGLAVMWMQLGDRLMGGQRSDESEEAEENGSVELDSVPRQPMGFASAVQTLELEEEDE